MKWWKEVARPGDYWYVGPDGKPAVLKVTPEITRYWYDQGKQMLAAGLSIPVPLEHQEGVQAMTPAEKAAANLLNNTGWVEKYAMRGDRLYSLTNIADDDINKKLPSTIKYTSPWINSFVDGNGKQWNGVISHLALTSRPRIINQEPFTSPEAALSHAVSLSFTPAQVPTGGLALSRAGLIEPGPKGGLVPHYPMAFSIWAGAKKLATDDEPPVKKEPPAKEGDKKPPPKDGDEPDLENLEAPEEEMEMTLTDILREIVGALWGIDLPEETDEDSLAQNLLKGLMAQLKGGNPDMNSAPPPPAGATPPAPPVTQESPPMYMSLEDVNKIADPTVKNIAMSLYQTQLQNKALVENTLTAATMSRDARLQRLARRLPAAARDKLLARLALPSAKLSLSADGKVVDPLAEMLDLMESALVDLPAMLSNPANVTLTEQPHPEDPSIMTEDRRQSVVAELVKNTGLPAA